MDFWYRPFGAKALILAPASLAYGLVTKAWHLAFDLGLRKAERIDGAHVISVGNLVVGGAGKTPVVIHLANEATKRGHRVAVLDDDGFWTPLFTLLDSMVEVGFVKPDGRRLLQRASTAEEALGQLASYEFDA